MDEKSHGVRAHQELATRVFRPWELFNRHTFTYASPRSKATAQSFVSLFKGTKVSLLLNVNPQTVLLELQRSLPWLCRSMVGLPVFKGTDLTFFLSSSSNHFRRVPGIQALPWISAQVQ